LHPLFPLSRIHVCDFLCVLHLGTLLLEVNNLSPILVFDIVISGFQNILDLQHTWCKCINKANNAVIYKSGIDLQRRPSLHTTPTCKNNQMSQVFHVRKECTYRRDANVYRYDGIVRLSRRSPCMLGMLGGSWLCRL